MLEVEQVGITTNFFELGGHSLKATQVVSRIHRDLGVEVPLRDVFNSPTIAELAELIRGARGTAYQRIERQPDRDDYPLSNAQRRLWVLTQIEDCSAAYNMPGALLLEGSIDIAAFQSAFDQVTRRHESLRTVFVVVDGEPRQRVLSQIDSTIALIDLSSEEDPEEQARELARADAHTVFDLSQGPLVRMSLLKLNAERHVLLFNIHHIISDDWSTNVLVREFVQLYEAARQNTSNLLPILPIQYRDYAAWQNNFLASDDVAALRTYWQEVLAGELPTLELHTDFPRPPIKTYEGACLSFDLDSVTTDELIELGRGHEASLFMTLVAVVKVLLHRYTGQEDIILGFPIAGRSHTDLEDQIGLYINMLPLRDQLHGDMPFESLLRQVRETATGAFNHQAYPFDRLVVEVNLVRDVSRSPMFDVIVVLQNVGEEDLSLEGVSIRPFADVYAGSKYDLSFTCEQRGGRLHVNLVYNTDLFRPSRIEQIRNHFLELVKSVPADPATPIGRLNILPNDERRRVLSLDKALPAAGRTHPSLAAQRRETDLVQWFEAQAEKTPRSVAVVSAPRESVADELLSDRLQLTYAELNARANQLAHHLRELGVGPNVLVGIWLERSIDMVVGLLGILKAGGAYVPFDPNHPADRIKFMLEDAGVGVLITERKIAPQLPDVVARVFCLDSESDLLAQQPSHSLAPVTRPQNLAYVIYTSGSTGRPKGVQVTHQNVVRLFTLTEHGFGFGPADVWTLFHSFAFDFSVWELWGGSAVRWPVGHRSVLDYTIARHVPPLVAQRESHGSEPDTFRVSPVDSRGTEHGSRQGSRPATRDLWGRGT